MVWTINGTPKSNIKTKITSFLALFGLLAALFISSLSPLIDIASAAPTAETVTITDSTAAAENDKGGWLFNRDPNNATPIEFNRDEKVIGEGALYVKPLSSTPAHKFIGEYFAVEKMENLESFSYDFKIGPGGSVSDANEFYLNVYVNFSGSSELKYYDCKYDVIPNSGSTSGFTTVTFDPTNTFASNRITKRADSPQACPSVPADMGPAATVRLFAINLGDTSANDTALDGYFDNVVYTTLDKKTTFDFDPEPLPVCETSNTTFDTFSNGSVNGQNGWKVTGPYDQEITDNTYGYSSFGCKSLRMSNATTSSSFGDHTFSYSTTNEAGETSAENGGLSGGDRKDIFEAQWDFASTKATHQPGLAITVSPDRGDGARMSWIQMVDDPSGWTINFYDYQSGPGFVYTPSIVTGLDRTTAHTVKVVMELIDGPQNDVVKIYVDGVLAHEGTSWEDYFREQENTSTRTVDSLLFRASGPAAPATEGEGFLFDNVLIATSDSDSEAPQTTFTSPLNGATVKSTDIAGMITDNVNVTQYSFNVSGPASWSTKKWYPNTQSINFDLNLCDEDRLNTCDESTLPEGEYKVRVAAYDGNGNRDISTNTTFTLDRTPPTITVKDSSVGNTTDKVFSNVSFKLYDKYKIDKVTINGVEKNLTDSQWSDVNGVKPGTFGAVEGENTLVAYDVAGNTTTYTFRLDTVKPTLTVKDNYVGDKDNNLFQEVSFKLFDQYKIDKVTINGVVKDLTNNQWSDVNFVKPGVFGAVEGENTIVLFDIAGNTTSYTFTLDTTAPEVPEINGFYKNGNLGAFIACGGLTNSTSILIDWDDVPGASYYWFGTKSNQKHKKVTASEYSGNMTPGNNPYYYTVIAVDAAGNESAVSERCYLTLDQENPSSTHDLADLVSGEVTITQQITDNVAPQSGKLRIWKLDENGNQDNTKFFAIGDVAVDSDGKVVYTLDTLNDLFGDGEYRAKFTATDTAGNQSVVQKDFTVDNSAPVVAITSITENSDGSYTIEGTTDDPADVNVALAGPTPTSGNATPTGGAWSFVTSILTAGDYVVTAISTDTAGNTPDPAAESNFTVSAPAGADGGQNTGGTEGNTGTNNTDNGTQNQAINTPALTFANTAFTPITQPQVLGATTDDNTQNTDDEQDEDEETTDVLGSATDNFAATTPDASTSCSKILGLCWYYWIPIVLIILGLGYYGISRSSSEN